MPPPTPETSATPKRRPRYRRVGERERPALMLTDRDRELIKAIYEHRFVTSRQLQELVPGSAQGILRRLHKLFHHHYVDRLKLSNNAPVIYATGNRGADELARYGIPRHSIEWTSKNHVQAHYLRHSLMITGFRHALALALREQPEATLTFWEPSGSFRIPVRYEDTVQGPDGGQRTKVITTAVIPDGFFALQTVKGTGALCLEADRSTMSTRRYLLKCKSYYHYWKEQVLPHRKSLRVLTITLSEERTQNLRHIARQASPDGRGLDIFWFACEKHYLAQPSALLSPIWQTPGDESVRSLLV